MAITINIRDDVSPLLQQLPRVLAEQSKPAVGAAVVGLFQQNFRTLGRNKNNWPTTNFWAGAVRATNFQVQPDGVRINVNQQGVLQRWKGGTINAKPGKWLTIPARQEAYGRRAREFNNLHFVLFRSGTAALVENQSQDVSFGRKRKDGSRKVTPGAERGGGVFYWLTKSVRQDGDPRVVPTGAAIGDTARRTIAGIVARFKARGGGA